MFKFASWLPIILCTAAVLFFIGSGWLLITGHWVWAIPTSIATLVFGSLSYTGFRLQHTIETVTETAYNVVGSQVEKVADAVVERVKKA